MSPFSSIPWNRNGFSVTFDHNVTEAGTGTMYPDLNVYYNGNLRETNDLAGGFHEEVGCIGQFTVVPYTGANPVCTLPATAPACPTAANAAKQFDLCYIAVGANNAWATAISATVTGGPFGLDYGSNGGGYREYTVVQSMTGTRTGYDSSLNAAPASISSVQGGGVLYSVSSSYSYLSPGALLNASGITFGLSSAATVPGTSSSTNSINLMSPAIGVYQENAGTVPAYSYLRHTYYNSAAGNRYCVPSFQPAGCAAPSGSLPSGSLSMQLVVSSPSWSSIQSNPVFGYQLMEDIAYTVGTGQLYALPLMSCASASQSGSNTAFTFLISNAAGNASALAAAIQAQVATAATTPFTTRQSGAVLSTTLTQVTPLSCQSSNSSSSSGLSGGAIAGIVIGSVVGALLLLLVLLLLCGCAGRRSTGDGINKPARMHSTEESQISRQEAEMTQTN